MPSEKPARVELDVTADIDLYREPERYAAAVARADRDFAELDAALAASSLPAQEDETALGD